MVLSMPLTALATDAIDKKLALRCTESLFFKGLDGVLEGYPGIAYPSTWQQGTGLYTYEPRYDVSQTKRGKNQLCANYYGFVRPSQVSGNGKQANCKTNITGIKVILKSKKGKAWHLLRLSGVSCNLAQELSQKAGQKPGQFGTLFNQPLPN